MNKNGFHTSWLSLAGFLVAAGMGVGIAQSALAQIIEDNTLGSEGSVITPDVVIQGIPSDRIDAGARRGANLFHSFEQFSIEVGRGAYFSNPEGVVNILSRVTGGDPSNLFGTLGVLGKANLFFLNPNGILFGPGSSLNLQGSFLATTADGLVFPNGEAFSTLNPQPPSLLTVSAPLGLQYGPQPSAAITTQDSELVVASGRSLVLTGGVINLENSLLAVDVPEGGGEGGHIELGAVAGVGAAGLDVNGVRLSLDFPDTLDRADVSLTNGSELNVAAAGGDITITARDLDILSSFLIAGIALGFGAEGNQAGDIILDTTEAINIAQSSSVANIVDEGAIGNSGNVNITARTLSVNSASQLDTGTFGKGDAGNVKINAADRVVLDDGVAFSDVFEGAVGDGGDIIINTGSLEIFNGFQLQAQTAGQGNAGNVIVNAARVVFDGVDVDGFPAAAFSDVEAGAVGDGGNIKITAETLSLTDALLEANTNGQGNAGKVIITVTGELRAVDSNILTTAAQSSGGTIDITAQDIRLFGDSNIRTNVFSGAGEGGDITLTADTILAFDDSDILAFAQDGRGGNITLNTSAFFGENFHPDVIVTNPEELDGNDRVDLNASGAISGVISLPDVTFVENDFVELPERPVNSDTLLATSCVARSQAQPGRFIITGSGSLPERPGETPLLPYSTGTIRPLPVEASSDARDISLWQRGEAIVESQGVYPLADGRLVLSRECS